MVEQVIGRRELLTSVLSAIVVAATHSVSRAQTLPSSIVVTSFGGVWEKALKESIAACFEKKTGVKATPLIGSLTEWMAKIRANPENPPVAVIWNTELLAIEAIQLGIVDEIPLDRVANLRKLVAEFPAASLYEHYQRKGAMTTFASSVLVYNKKKIARPPATWEEFYENSAKGTYGKQVTVPGISYPWTISILLWNIARTYGDDISKMDIAFAKLRAIKNNVVKFWTSPADLQNLLETGEATIGIYWDGRAWGWRDGGAGDWLDYYVPGPRGVMGAAILQKVRNAPEIAWEFVNCAFDPNVQAAFATPTRYSPSHPMAPVSAELRKGMAPRTMVEMPPTDLIKYRSAWVERWNKEIGA